MRKFKVLWFAIFIAACGGGAAKRDSGADGAFVSSLDAMPASAVRACSLAASSACGGDIVGTWKLAGICSHSMTEQQIIDEYGKAFGDSAVGKCGLSSDMLDAGYARFRADGTWQIDEMTGVAITYSEKCLGEIGQSCDNLRAYSPTDASMSISKTCQSSNGTCSCSFMRNSHPNGGSYTTDGISYHLYNADGSKNATRGYCVKGEVISVLTPGESFGGEGVVIAIRTNENITDLDASITLPKFDASADKPVADAAVDKPIADATVDKSRVDAGIDALTCDITKPCTKNSDCSSGLTCQKVSTIDGQSVNAMICMPSQCPSCNPRTCVYNNDPKVCSFIECQSADAGIADVAVDKPKIDVAPIDAMPVSPAEMPPSMAAVCPAMAAAPCGGDLSGDWTIMGVCDPYLSDAELLSQEDKECSTWIDYIDNGTASFGPGGVCNVDEKLKYNTAYSTSCLAQASDTCVAKDGRIRKEIGKDYVTEASCAASSSEVCMCTNTFDPPAAADACTYTVQGNTFTFVSPPKTFSAESYDYCVQGNTLSVFFASWSEAGKAADKKAAVVMVRTSTIDAGTNSQ